MQTGSGGPEGKLGSLDSTAAALANAMGVMEQTQVDTRWQAQS